MGPWFCQSQYTSVVDISVDAEARVSDVQSQLYAVVLVCMNRTHTEMCSKARLTEEDIESLQQGAPTVGLTS